VFQCKSGLIVLVRTFPAFRCTLRDRTAGTRRTPMVGVQALSKAHLAPGDIRATPFTNPGSPGAGAASVCSVHGSAAESWGRTSPPQRPDGRTPREICSRAIHADPVRHASTTGATEAESVDEAVTSAEVAITSLANDDAVRETALGEGGIHTAIGDRTWTTEPGAKDARLASEMAERTARRGFASGRQFAICTRLPPALASTTTTSPLSHGRTAERSHRNQRPSRKRLGSTADDPDHRLPTRPFVSTLPPIMFIMLS